MLRTTQLSGEHLNHISHAGAYPDRFSESRSMTRLYLNRRAIVDPTARAILYGRIDVSLCTITLTQQAPATLAIGTRLPREAAWLVTPLSHAARTADAIQSAG
jgi:alpha-ribazole phosphatase